MARIVISVETSDNGVRNGNRVFEFQSRSMDVRDATKVAGALSDHIDDELKYLRENEAAPPIDGASER